MALERRFAQERGAQQPFHAALLILQRFHPPALTGTDPAVLCLPLVKGRARDPVAPTHLFGPGSSLLLAQHPDNLLLREATSFHRSVSFSGDGLYLKLAEFSGCRPPERRVQGYKRFDSER